MRKKGTKNKRRVRRWITDRVLQSNAKNKTVTICNGLANRQLRTTFRRCPFIMQKKCGYGDMWQNIKNLGAERTVTKKCKEKFL